MKQVLKTIPAKPKSKGKGKGKDTPVEDIDVDSPYQRGAGVLVDLTGQPLNSIHSKSCLSLSSFSNL